MSDSEIVRRYKSQRRRNAKTIRERNETIRRLETKVEMLREVVDDYRWVAGILRELLAERQEVKP